MDVPRLQAWFRTYIQTLFSLGYLNRSQFKPFYLANMAAHGFMSNSFSLFVSNALISLHTMTMALVAPEPNFPMIIAFAQHLGDSARGVGALRTANLTVFLKAVAEVAHKDGCITYIHMLSTEIEALDYCFSIITELETAIAILGLGFPFDW